MDVEAMKDDLESRLLAKNRDSGHPVIWHLNNPDGPEAADALKAKDAEIARLREALRTAINLADMYVNECDTGSIYQNGMTRARKALQDTDNG